MPVSQWVTELGQDDRRGAYETALVLPSLDRLDVGVAFTSPVTNILAHALLSMTILCLDSAALGPHNRKLNQPPQIAPSNERRVTI